MIRLRLCVCALVLSSVAAACGKSAPEQESLESEAPVAVHAAKAGPAQVTLKVRATGTTLAAPGAELVVTAPFPARVGQIPHGEGDHVARGQLLVEFDIPSLNSDMASRESALTQSRARVANAEAARTRLAGLLDQGIAARREVEDADKELSDAKAALAEASVGLDSSRRLLDRGRVIAPFSGVVVRRFHNPGDLVDASASDPVLRFADPARIEVEALVPASDVPRIAARQPVDVRGPGDSHWTGVVLATPAVVDAATASAHVRVSISGGTSPPLGLPVEVTITVLERAAAVAVPATAVVKRGDASEVFVIADGKATLRQVQTGVSSASDVEIRSGLQAGDLVVVGGAEGLPDGAHVSVTP